MDFEALYQSFLQSANKEQAQKMSAYMRNLFPFLGIPTPKRKQLCKEFFKEAKQKKIAWDFIALCWQCPYRELQYLAIDYLSLMKEYLSIEDLPEIKKLILTKSWWDTIDGLDRIVGNLALMYPHVNEDLLVWSVADNIWLRRIAIDHQLGRQEKTNRELLEKIIVNNFGQTEFFINKAIGWSLRDYSKTDPKWVQSFIDKYRAKLAPLSLKEASKYL